MRYYLDSPTLFYIFIIHILFVSTVHIQKKKQISWILGGSVLLYWFVKMMEFHAAEYYTDLFFIDFGNRGQIVYVLLLCAAINTIFFSHMKHYTAFTELISGISLFLVMETSNWFYSDMFYTAVAVTMVYFFILACSQLYEIIVNKKVSKSAALQLQKCYNILFFLASAFLCSLFVSVEADYRYATLLLPLVLYVCSYIIMRSESLKKVYTLNIIAYMQIIVASVYHFLLILN